MIHVLIGFFLGWNFVLFYVSMDQYKKTKKLVNNFYPKSVSG